MNAHHDAHVITWRTINDALQHRSHVNAWVHHHARQLAQRPLNDGFNPTALHEYADAEGLPLFWRIRLKRSLDGEKWIRPLRRIEGGRFDLKQPEFLDGTPLYLLPQLAARSDAPVWVVEGEACADAISKMGLVATTSGGADSAGRANWQPLAKRTVTIWPDNDEAGMRYAKAVHDALIEKGCVVSVIDVAALSLPPKADCVDWIAAHPDATADDVASLRKAGASESTGGIDHEAAEDIALEKHLPDATMSRAVIFNMRRKLPGETIERLRHAEPGLFDRLASMLARFADDYRDVIQTARPDERPNVRERPPAIPPHCTCTPDNAGSSCQRLHPRFTLLPVRRKAHRPMFCSADGVEQQYQPGSPATAWIDGTHQRFHDHEKIKNVMCLVVRGIGGNQAILHAFDHRQGHCESAIPESTMVGANVTDRGQCVQDIFENLNGGQTQSLRDLLFRFGVLGVLEPAGERAQAHGFHDGPDRRQERFLILAAVMHHEGFAAFLHLARYAGQVAGMLPRALEQFGLHVCVTAVAQGNRSCPTGTHRHLNALDCLHDQQAQFAVKNVEAKHLLEGGAGFEIMVT